VIFVTVGSQMPFDRMVRAVDDWALARDRHDVFAQIGKTRFRPRRIEWTPLLDPAAFEAAVRRSTAVVAHAGVGAIVAALEAERPIVTLPRRAALGETRSDHQFATAEHFRHLGIEVALDEHALPAILDRVDTLKPGRRIPHDASPELIGALRRFLAGEPL
jgi:UDP-N-acetylglucosamine transferase subunit ALG13